MADISNPQIAAGTNVSIKDLVGAPQYNNMTGIVQSFESDTGRYNVALHKMKKNLGLKAEKLIVLCSKCAKKEHDTDCGCQRCDFPYCSETCRDADWDTAHKGKCVPKNISEPPEPVLRADTGDAIFETSRNYIELAAQAGSDGRYAEQIQLMEAFITKDDKQPSPFLQLFQRYSETEDHEKAFSFLEKAVNLFVDPRLAPGSDPQSVAIPVQPELTELYGMVIRQGQEFIREKRVMGRSGNELMPDAKLLYQLVELSDKIPMEDTSVLDRYSRSELYHTLGNVLRKVNDEALRTSAINVLELADEVVKPIDERNVNALMLIPEIITYDASIAQDPTEKDEKLQAAVDRASEVMNLMVDELDHPLAYQSQILLGTMLYNQVVSQNKRVAEEDQKRMKEIYDLLGHGYNTALKEGDQHGMHRAQRILSQFGTSDGP